MTVTTVTIVTGQVWKREKSSYQNENLKKQILILSGTITSSDTFYHLKIGKELK